jgi:membrane protease YdiL (CAAX protease family)
MVYSLIACLITWAAKFFMASAETGHMGLVIPMGVLQLIAQFGPSTAALIMIFAEKGKTGIVSLLKNLISFDVHVKWFAFALFFELFLFHLVLAYCFITGYGDISFQGHLLPVSYLNFLLSTFTLAILTGLGEEPGWRGYLLPRLQAKYTILMAWIILSLVNSIWHVRNDCIILLLQGDYTGFSRVYFPDMGLRILISLPAVMVMVYLFNQTKGRLMVMVLFHGAANASYEWVKEITGNPDPGFTLPVFAALLWITTIYFLPKVMKQAKHHKLITQPF